MHDWEHEQAVKGFVTFLSVMVLVFSCALLDTVVDLVQRT